MNNILSFLDYIILQSVGSLIEKEGGAPMFRQKKRMDPLAAGLLGIALGAAGTAVGIAMKDEKNRKIVANKARNFANWGNDRMQSVKQSATHILSDIPDNAQDLKSKAKKS